MSRIVKSTYYSNWGDRIGYPLAHRIAKPLSTVSFITPNLVTATAFSLFTLGCIGLVALPNYLALAALFIFLGYVGDDVDGQLARMTKKYTTIGDYLDKVLDVLKIFLITFFAGLSAYLSSGNVLYIILGFIACFFFNYRYYIKLETMFSAISRDSSYLDNSAVVRKSLEKKMDDLYQKKPSNIQEAMYIFFVKNRTLFFFDEAEFAIIIALGALFNKIGVALWVLALAQVTIVAYRLFERGYQLTKNSPDLLKPLRK